MYDFLNSLLGTIVCAIISAVIPVIITAVITKKKNTIIKGLKETVDKKRGKGVILTKRDDTKSIVEVIDQAKYDIFISGFTLTLLIPHLEKLLDKAKNTNVEVKILFVDLNDDGLKKVYKDMGSYEYGAGEPTHEAFVDCLKYQNIKIRVIDSMMPVDFVAHDLNGDRGYIRAHHRFNNKMSDGHPNIELKTGDDWYENYREQINTIWKHGKDWDGK